MAGPAQRPKSGRHASWGDEARETVGAVTPDNTAVFDPPLTRLYVGGAGNIVIVCDADDETDAAKRSTIAVTAGQVVRDFAIRQVRATSTTATGLIGFR